MRKGRGGGKKTGEKRENMKFEVRGFVAALFEERSAVIDGAILSGGN